MKLLFATGNENKYELMKRRLKELENVEVIMPKHINIKIDVNEDGKTAEENAIKKAKAYYDEFRKQIKEDPTKAIKFAVIYSYGANEEEQDGILDEVETKIFMQKIKEYFTVTDDFFRKNDGTGFALQTPFRLKTVPY